MSKVVSHVLSSEGGSELPRQIEIMEEILHIVGQRY
jgi:hypothetical protein